MNKYLKYFIIFTSVITPFALEVILKSGFGNIITLLIPGFIIAIFVQLYDLNQTFKDVSQKVIRIGEHNIQEDMETIVQSLRKVDVDGDSIFTRHTADLIRQMKSQFVELSNGVIKITDDIELSSLPTDLMNKTMDSLDATLLWTEDTLKEGRGESYMQAMSDAISKRKVRVRRLFIVPDTENIDEQIKSRMKLDVSQGVEVKLISEPNWNAVNNEPEALIDFGIWDNKKVWIYGRMNNGRRSAYLSNKSGDLIKYRKLFNAKWIDAQRI